MARKILRIKREVKPPIRGWQHRFAATPPPPLFYASPVIHHPAWEFTPGGLFDGRRCTCNGTQMDGTLASSYTLRRSECAGL
jgi:hypothetical protein